MMPDIENLWHCKVRGMWLHVKFNLDIGAAVAASLWILLMTDFYPKHTSTFYIAASGARILDFGGARLKCYNELYVTRSITGRNADVRKILAIASQMCNKGNHVRSWMVIEAS